MSKQELKKIGYWYSAHEPDLPNPKDFVDESWDPAEKVIVFQYLQLGEVLHSWRGFSRCRICGDANGSQCLYDSVYQWPSGLGHYVLQHNVKLPQDFIDHATRVATGAPAPLWNPLFGKADLEVRDQEDQEFTELLKSLVGKEKGR